MVAIAADGQRRKAGAVDHEPQASGPPRHGAAFGPAKQRDQCKAGDCRHRSRRRGHAHVVEQQGQQGARFEGQHGHDVGHRLVLHPRRTSAQGDGHDDRRRQHGRQHRGRQAQRWQGRHHGHSINAGAHKPWPGNRHAHAEHDDDDEGRHHRHHPQRQPVCGRQHDRRRRPQQRQHGQRPDQTSEGDLHVVSLPMLVAARRVRRPRRSPTPACVARRPIGSRASPTRRARPAPPAPAAATPTTSRG